MAGHPVFLPAPGTLRAVCSPRPPCPRVVDPSPGPPVGKIPRVSESVELRYNPWAGLTAWKFLEHFLPEYKHMVIGVQEVQRLHPNNRFLTLEFQTSKQKPIDPYRGLKCWLDPAWT